MVDLIRIKGFILNGHERTIRARKNILGLLLLKGYNILVNLLLVPLTLQLLDDYKYGVWIILFNVITWIAIFDIGIGNGLRNKLTEAIARKDIKNAKEYISTSYVAISFIALLICLVFIIPWLCINWGKVLNVGNDLESEISLLIGLSFFLTCLQFIFKIIDTILTAAHKPAISAFLYSISNSIILCVFIAFKSLIYGNLVVIGTIFVLTPTIVLFFSNLILFNNSFKRIKPSLKDYRIKKVKEILSLGVKFFIIQIAGLVIFQTDSLIIAHVLSPKEVTPYNIVFRYFGVLNMLAATIMVPFWSAYTEAASNKDYAWIIKTMKSQLRLFIGFCLITILMLIFANPLIKIWIQKEFAASHLLIIGMAVYTIISIWNNIFALLLNALSITKVQVITAILGTVLNIPLSIFFASRWGSGGVIIGTIISLAFFAVGGSIQTFCLIKSWKRI
ncbi:O-antigen/teichoic acid export membrane protein [Breznakibacter xylanolyticus]|uniref:O-antigen/teichoic acid export membrane protein n=2 Tax=Breznakibacter xylanolyticus TaxID=990 RepID=A0A2W7NM28_9BACT|nr:O-antigen/teichoic acid export membrane protein [Breznakibacter xylanolyticus]